MHGHTNELVTRGPHHRVERVTNPAARPQVASQLAVAGICRSPPAPTSGPGGVSPPPGPAPERTPPQPRRKEPRDASRA
jgi:hypothetical protein